MSTRSSWTHIRTSYFSSDVRKGLEARIADPLWMLARQWQFGEFDGDDAASPAKIRLRHGSVPVTGLSRPDAPNQVHKLTPGTLTEPAIEAGAPLEGPASPRMSGEAGLQFLRHLPEEARGAARATLQKRFPLALPDGIDGQTARVLSHLARGSFDAARFRGWIVGNHAALAREIGVDAAAMKTAVDRWTAYFDGRFEPRTGDGFWQQDRLEHSANVHADQGKTISVRLTAPEHHGGHLDWHSFDVTKASGNDKPIARQKTEWLLPTPISYSGMPAERYWDFEDGEVFFGGLTLARTDLAQVILTEFATVYSNDWFMVPVPAETGTLSRVTLLEVHDIFGEVTEIRPAAVQDGGQRPWRFFEHRGDPSVRQKVAPWVYVPRAVVGGEESRPVERVLFTRDEMANLAWGIEQIVETGAALPRDRAQHWNRVRDAFAAYTGEEAPEQPPETDEDDPAWVYRLLSTAPPHWVPFAPEVANNLPTGRLVRSRMGEWDLLGAAREALAGARGQIMDPTAPMVLQEEEVLRGGTEASRRYQTARAPDGRLLLWTSNAKRPAGGDRSSGRETDLIETRRRR